ncbi:MAG: hypothetical protein RLZ10_1960 [Bacteroidota bacterium]|jgi:hypothetical protein
MNSVLANIKSILKSTLLCGNFLILCFVPFKTKAATIKVSSISALQTASNTALPGDIIVLANNTYLNNTINITTSNITVRAETPGGAILNGTNSITISGNNVTFSGFQFISGSITGVVISVKGNYVILDQLNFNGYSAQKYINLAGQYDEVAYCNFENKPTTAPIGNLIHIAPNGTVPNYAKIRYCSFKNMNGAGGDNGNECIRIANGAQSTFICRTTVEYCYFENTGNGDSEAISVKSRENTLRYNTFRNNQNAMMVFRNGNDNVAYGNFFIGAGGIRVKEANNIYCYNNYFENAGVGGTTNAVTYDYVSPNLKNVNFIHNTFVDCGLISLSSGATNNTWANNIFKKSSGNIFSGSSAGIAWSGNIYKGSLGISIPLGVINQDPLLTKNTENYYGLSNLSPAIDNSSTTYPAIMDIANLDDDASLSFDISGQSRSILKSEKDAGCDEFTSGNIINRPLLLTDVGPSYLGGPGGILKQNQTITFNPLPAKSVGDPDFSPGATSSSGLVVSYTSSNLSVATIVNGNIRIIGAGSTTISALQAGDAYYNAATTVTQTLTVKAPLIYTYSPTTTTILAGSLSIGTFGNLETNNSSYYVVNSTKSGTRNTDWYGSTTISQTPSTVSKLTIHYDGKNSASKSQILYLYNWTELKWVQIDSRTVSTTDVLITSIQNSPISYISSSGEIRVRVFSSGGTKNYIASGDWMSFSIETSSSLQTLAARKIILQEKNQPVFSIYPNPTSKFMSIHYMLKNEDVVELTLFNLSGQLVKEIINNQKQTTGDYKKIIDVSELNDGIYVIKLSTSSYTKTLKIIISK